MKMEAVPVIGTGIRGFREGRIGMRMKREWSSRKSESQRNWPARILLCCSLWVEEIGWGRWVFMRSVMESAISVKQVLWRWRRRRTKAREP